MSSRGQRPNVNARLPLGRPFRFVDQRYSAPWLAVFVNRLVSSGILLRVSQPRSRSWFSAATAVTGISAGHTCAHSPNSVQCPNSCVCLRAHRLGPVLAFLLPVRQQRQVGEFGAGEQIARPVRAGRHAGAPADADREVQRGLTVFEAAYVLLACRGVGHRAVRAPVDRDSAGAANALAPAACRNFRPSHRPAPPGCE